MKNPMKITLSNGTILHIEGNMLWGIDSNRYSIEFTRAQREILLKLADELNRPVSMSALYEAYNNDATIIDDKGIRDNVAKVKNTMPDSVKSSIKSVRGFGYKLLGIYEQGISDNHSLTTTATPTTEQYFNKSMGCLADLAGDYYGFYLDPFGEKSILGTYLHIKNIGTIEEPQLTAYAIVNIRSTEILIGDKISQVFTGSVENYRTAFKAFKQELTDNEKRCSWCYGPISTDGTLVNIHLNKNDSPEKWQILLDIAEYLRCNRERENENDFYRGGLGITLASRTIHGTFCFRMGIVRKTCINDAMIRDHDKMLKRLKILDDTEDAIWKPLKLSNYKDKKWYEWIMNE